jgi:hypothetical protein
MTSRLGFPRRSLSALACGATLLGVSACGSSTPTQVSQAVKSKLESTLEKIPLTAAEATEVTDCLVPTLKAHGITTLAAATTGSQPPWEKPAIDACVKQAGLTGSGNTGSGTATQPAAAATTSGTDTNSADAAACRHLAPDAQRPIADNGDAASIIVDIGAIGVDLQGFSGYDGGNSDMSQSLATAFNALGNDISGGGTSNMTAESVTADAHAVVSGCASAGVSLPSGFVSAVSAAAMSQAADPGNTGSGNTGSGNTGSGNTGSGNTGNP